jgi:hypothetical protein
MGVPVVGYWLLAIRPIPVRRWTFDVYFAALPPLPNIDRLFDRGFVSFAKGAELRIRPVAHEDSMNKMGIVTDRVVNASLFAEPQREFLESNRSNVFLN